MKHSNLSDYAIKRLAQRKIDSDYQKELKKYRLKKIAWIFGDLTAWIVLIIAITALAMLDSASYTPGYVLGISVFYLAVYGAIRGVLG